MMTFHRLIVAGLDMHEARTGTDDDAHAAELTEAGYPFTGDDIRRFRVEGFPTHYIDAASGARLGMTGIEGVAFALQTLVPPPHLSCPSCTCGVPLAERRAIAEVFLEDGDVAAGGALHAYRAATGQLARKQRQGRCSDGVDTQAP